MSELLKQVISEFEEREKRGFKKYGTTMDRNDLSLEEWIQHLREELMDAILYLTKLKNDTQGRSNHQKENHRNDESINPNREAEHSGTSL